MSFLYLDIWDSGWYFHTVAIPISPSPFGYRIEDAFQESLDRCLFLPTGIHWYRIFYTSLIDLGSHSSVFVRLSSPGFAGIIMFELRM